LLRVRAVLLVFILTVSQKKNVDRADVDLARDRLAQARAASSASEADLDRLAKVLAAAQLELQAVDAKTRRTNSA
jgi:hypothetical protein